MFFTSSLPKGKTVIRSGFATWAAAVLLLSSCRWVAGYRTPEDIWQWQDATRPTSALREKAEVYQRDLEEHFQTPEGIVKYKRFLDTEDDGTYGDLADGPFFTGMYLASQALRFATTSEPAARREILRTLDGLDLLMEVTGRRGLLARYVSPRGVIPGNAPWKWHPSTTRPAYLFRADVSKDQYAGFIHGLGVTLAVVDDPDIRRRAADLACAAADHLIDNDLRIIDVDGSRTTYGDLSGTYWCLPLGVNSLISLAIARVSADGSEDGRYAGFYRRLVAEGYVEATHWAHFDPMRFGRRTNEHMAYLALYALLLLTHDPATLERLGSGEQRTWNHVRGEHNAFFAFVHAMRGVKTGDGPGRSGEVMEAAAEGREALFEFPDDKIEWPVDLTREGFDVPRSWLNTNKGFPRSRVAIPLHLRPRTSSFWGGNPYQMAGCLSPGGRVESAGVDFLLAYWMGRYHGFLKPGD